MAQVGKPGGGVSGKPGGGMGGLGGGSTPMTAEQAAAANGTRNQNLYTTVGGLSRPGAAARPSGPAGPPQPTPGPAGPAGPPPLPRQRPTLNPNLLSPLINGRDPLTGAPPAEAMTATQYTPGTLGEAVYNPDTGKMDPPPTKRGKRRLGSSDPVDDTQFRTIG